MRESKFFVRVDVRALRHHLADRRRATAGGVATIVTNDDAFDWLTSHGFNLGRGGWYANSTTLNRLYRTAIISSTRVQ
jgi:hypothetical protein